MTFRDFYNNKVMASLEAIKYLNFFKSLHPGNAVEIRIPYVGAISCLKGVNHRRGTPPNVVEMSAETWLSLCNGEQRWEKLAEEGKIIHSGSLSDISAHFPLANFL